MIAAQPSRTAMRVAMRRAAHQLLDTPVVLDVPIAIPILGREMAASLRADPTQFEKGRLSSYMRAFFAARSRFAEDQLAAARAAGVRQYVILGAGLDTFAYRDPSPDLRLQIWEVDHPATQAWKHERLAESSISIPQNLRFVPIDFDRDSLPDALMAAGFDSAAGAVFSWLGVVPYLARAVVMATLAQLASMTTTAGGIVFDFGIPPEQLTMLQRMAFDALAARVQAAGEPWVTFFDPVELSRDLRAVGFAVAEDVPPAEINARYFSGRTDGLEVGGMGHLMWAGAARSV